MARGKHSSAAEARRVRESALSEVEAGRRAIVRLTSENAQLRETLNAERSRLTEKLQLANALIAEGTSAEVEALKEELARSRSEALDARRQIALAVSKLMNRPDFKASFAFYAECAELLGLTVQELMPRAAEINRNSRRASPKNLRLLAQAEGQHSTAGLAALMEGFEAGENAGRVK
jgi:hypothetical protein